MITDVRLLELIKEQALTMVEIMDKQDFIIKAGEDNDFLAFRKKSKELIELIDYEAIITLEIMKYGLIDAKDNEKLLTTLKEMREKLDIAIIELD